MPENHRKNLTKLELRTRVPRILQAGAAVGLVAALVVLIVGVYRSGSEREFRMKGFPTSLSKESIAEISNYERTETDGDIKKYYIKAAKATTFADNHQELEDVYLEVFDDAGQAADKITAAKGVYVPEENKNFTAYFAGGVNIETRDALKVKTEQVTYRKVSETAEAEELVEFERNNVSGRSVGAFVNIAAKRLELLKQVEIDAFAVEADDELSRTNVKSARITADRAVVDQIGETIDLNDNVFIGIIPSASDGAVSQPTDITAGSARLAFVERQVRNVELSGGVTVSQKPTAGNRKWTKTSADRAVAAVRDELKKLELIERVSIETGSDGEPPTKITCGYAVYEKDADRFDLRLAVHIATVRDDRTTNIRSAEAVYEQTAGRIVLSGGAEIDNGREFLKGDTVNAELFPDRSLRAGNARGSAFLRQTTPEQTIEVAAGELNAEYAVAGRLRSANAVGGPSATLVPANAAEYSRVTMAAPRSIALAFGDAGLLARMTTDGRTTILMKAPESAPDAADRTLTADVVRTFFWSNGKDIRRAEAVGNGELLVQPLTASDENYRTTVTAPRFDCEFFPTGNNAKVCVAQSRTKTVRVPTVPRDDRGVQTLTAERLTASFDERTYDVDQFDASGNAKFVELDRTGIAERMTFAAKEKIVRLRGGEPTIWDSQARAKAIEIDWDTRNQRSFLRGSVSTTYYNQKQTGGATPFTESNKPVFLTAANAEFDHRAQTGLYTGNARAWQENNYVRGDRILIRQKEAEMYSEGSVQSVVYDSKNADRKNVPVFASANRMSYKRDARVLRYEESVDIRQGTDRVTGGIATVLLNERNEMSQTTVENDVVLTQPKRRATGRWAQYTNDSEIAILRGDPARVEDAESGSTQGAEITMYRRQNKVTNEAKTETGSSGRIRSVYKVKKN